MGHIGDTLTGPTLLAFGSEEQKAKYLPPIRDGVAFWSQGYSSPVQGPILPPFGPRRSRMKPLDNGRLREKGVDLTRTRVRFRFCTCASGSRQFRVTMAWAFSWCARSAGGDHSTHYPAHGYRRIQRVYFDDAVVMPRISSERPVMAGRCHGPSGL